MVVVGLVGVLAAGGSVAWWRWDSVADPVLPESLESLERSLVQMINEHVAKVRQAPRSASARGQLALVYEANEMWPEAYASFDDAARLDSSTPLWSHHAAVAQYHYGQTDDAIRRWERLVRKHPGFAPSLHRLGYALLAQGRPDEAETWFRKCHAVTGDAPEVLAGLAETYLQRGQPEVARGLLERGAQIDSNYKTIHYLLGLCYRDLGRMGEADRELNLGLNAQVRYLSDEASDQIPQYACGISRQLSLAAAMRYGGRADQAVVLLKRALTDYPDEPGVMYGLADAYQAMGQLDAAFTMLKRAEGVGKNSHITSLKLAGLMMAQSRFDDSLEYADRAIQQAPALGEAYVARARALMELRRLEEARESLVTSLRYDTRNPDVYATLGYICMQLQDYVRAEEHLQIAARRNPNSIWNHLNLCTVGLQLGHYDTAEGALRDVQRLAPNDPSVQLLEARLRKLRR